MMTYELYLYVFLFNKILTIFNYKLFLWTIINPHEPQVIPLRRALNIGVKYRRFIACVYFKEVL